MSIFDAVFGDDSEADVSQHKLTTPEQDALLQQVLGILSGRVGGGARPFPGDLEIGPSTLEGLSLQALEDRAGDLVAGETEVLNAGKTALLEALTSDPTDIDEFFQTNVADPILEAFEENISTIGRRFGKNFFGTGRTDQESDAFEDMIDALTSERANLAFQNDQRTRDRKLTAAGMSPGVARGGTDELLALLTAGGVPRGIEEGNLLRSYQEFLRQQNQKNQDISQALAAVGLPTVENIATVTEGDPGLLSGYLAGGGGAPITSKLLSLF